MNIRGKALGFVSLVTLLSAILAGRLNAATYPVEFGNETLSFRDFRFTVTYLKYPVSWSLRFQNENKVVVKSIGIVASDSTGPSEIYMLDRLVPGQRGGQRHFAYESKPIGIKIFSVEYVDADGRTREIIDETKRIHSKKIPSRAANNPAMISPLTASTASKPEVQRVSTVDAQRADRETIQRAEQQIQSENRRTDVINATVDAAQYNPANTPAKTIERITGGLLDAAGLNSAARVQREESQRADATRVGQIILEEEKKESPKK